jgi:hypothetical protein
MDERITIGFDEDDEADFANDAESPNSDDEFDTDDSLEADSDLDEDEFFDELQPEGEAKNAENEAEPDQKFQLKHLGQQREVTRDEVIALAQQGMDYQRVRGQLDELRALKQQTDRPMEFLRNLASRRGLSVEALVEETKAFDLAKREGIAVAEARGRLSNERRERAFAVRELDLASRETMRSVQNQRAARVRNDVTAFAAMYPGVDPKSIPQNVWQKVRGGMPLVSAYAMHENSALKTQLRTFRQEADGRSRSIGSQRTAGYVAPDEFDSVWNDESDW